MTTEYPPLQILYLGPPASFSHQAALAAFPHSNPIPLPSFSSIFNALQSNHTYSFAILPIENSTNGSVVQVLDLLAKRSQHYPDLEVCGEHYLAVHHFLFTNHDRSEQPDTKPAPVLDLSHTKVLYTHPQVWTQCSKYLARHLQHAERIDVSSTSAAAKLVAKDMTRESAAICSDLAGKMFKLRCLAEGIEDDPVGNTTRFLVLRNRNSLMPVEMVPGTGQTGGKQVNIKSLLLFTIAHTVPGSLSKALEVFAEHGLNLTRIDTRPSREHSWHYVFFVECEELAESVEKSVHGRLKSAITGLQNVTENMVCLGSWVDMLQWNKARSIR